MKHLLHMLTWPVHTAVEWAHRKKPHRPQLKRFHKVTIGIVLMFTGSGLASIGHGLPEALHALLDVLGYFIHGYGALPIIRVVKEVFDIEDESRSEKKLSE